MNDRSLWPIVHFQLFRMEAIMYIKQLSVFMENREGRLEEITSVLAKEDVNILAFSLADTADYGVLRMIVDKPQVGEAALKKADISAKLTDVIVVWLDHKPGELCKLLKAVEKLNIEYMYPHSTGTNTSIVLKLQDGEEAVKELEKHGFSIMGEEAYLSNK